MFSDGKAIDDTYKVGYAVGNSPFGPFEDGVNSPILESLPDRSVVGPGHHFIFNEKGQDYMLYHRIFPQDSAFVLRQLCIDSLKFDKDHNILKVEPKGIQPLVSE